MKSPIRARIRDERGVALIAVLLLAILYFALIEMVMWESSQAFRSAQRFRSRVIAEALAESGAELAAQQLVASSSANIKADTGQGKITATMTRGGPNGDEFEIKSEARTSGVMPTEAHVVVRGRTNGNEVYVVRTIHAH